MALNLVKRWPIKSITVEGYKSLTPKHTIHVQPLTILAGDPRDTELPFRFESESRQHPVSSRCQSFLKGVADSAFQFQVVMSRDILMEWKRHRSRYSFGWLATMMAKRPGAQNGNPGARALRREMITAAISTDNRIASGTIRVVHSTGVFDTFAWSCGPGSRAAGA